MTIEQTGMILDLLEGAIPGAFSGERARNKGKTLRLWAEAFPGDDVSDVKAAVIAYANETEKGFFPTPGQIRAKMPSKNIDPPLAETDPIWAKQLERIEKYRGLKHRRREAGLPESMYEARQAGMSCEEYDRLVEAAGLGLEVIF